MRISSPLFGCPVGGLGAAKRPQATEALYCPRAGVLTFPCADCVRVLADDMLMAPLFMRMLLPDHQARCLRIDSPVAAPRNALVDNEDALVAELSMASVEFGGDGGEAAAAAAELEPAALVRASAARNRPIDNNQLDANDYESDEVSRGDATLVDVDGPERSQLHAIRALGRELAALRVRRSGKQSRADARLAYELDQRRLLRMYDDECTSRTSSISMAGRSIVSWYARGEHSLHFTMTLVDPRLSVWANSVARRAMRFEHACYITTAHGLALLLSYALMNAYEHVLDLHANFLVRGPPQVSKSYVLDVLERELIPRTTYHVTSSSSQAKTIDMDVNDAIGFAHEARPDAFRDSRGGGNDNAEAAMKEELGKCLVEREVFVYSATGARQTRKTSSQRIQALVFVTNLPHESFTPAIRSRMSCIVADTRYRTDKSTAELVNVDSMASSESQSRAAIFTAELRATQFLSYHIQKAIMIGALTWPTLMATDILCQRFLSRLQQRHSIQVEPRTLRRVSMLVRQFVIDRALRILYSSPASPYCGERRFSVQHLAYLDHYLYDCEEMFVMAVDMLRHEIVSPAREHMLQMFAGQFVTRPRAERLARHPPNTPGVPGIRSLYLDTAVTKNLAALPFAAATAKPALWQMHTGATPFVDQAPPFKRQYDCAYASAGCDVKTVASTLAKLMESTEHALDADSITSALRALTREMIRGRVYEWNAATNEPVVVAEQPVTSTDLVPAAMQVGSEFFIHLDVLPRVGGVDVVDEALAYCRGNVPPEGLPAEVHQLSGRTHEANRPYLLRVRKVTYTAANGALRYKRHSEALFRSTILAFPDEIRANVQMSAADTEVKRHVDDESRRARAIALHLDADSPACSMREHEQAIRAAQKEDFSVVYPDDMIADEAERAPLKRQRLRRANDDDDDDDDVD